MVLCRGTAAANRTTPKRAATDSSLLRRVYHSQTDWRYESRQSANRWAIWRCSIFVPRSLLLRAYRGHLADGDGGPFLGDRDVRAELGGNAPQFGPDRRLEER